MNKNLIKQALLTAALFTCSVGASVILGYAFSNSTELGSKSGLVTIKAKPQSKSWSFNRLLVLLVPKLG